MREEDRGVWWAVGLCVVVPWFFPAKAAKNYRLARLRKRDLLKAAALWNLEGEKIR